MLLTVIYSKKNTHTHTDVYKHDLSPFSINGITAVSQFRRSASVRMTDTIWIGLQMWTWRVSRCLRAFIPIHIEMHWFWRCFLETEMYFEDKTFATLLFSIWQGDALFVGGYVNIYRYSLSIQRRELTWKNRGVYNFSAKYKQEQELL